MQYWERDIESTFEIVFEDMNWMKSKEMVQL